MNQHQQNIIQVMSNPDIYSHAVSKLEHRETHISHVFLTGPYAYKIKKSLDLEFLDYTTLEKRKYYCQQETTLNQRLSHDVYLGVVAITYDKGQYYLDGPGKPVEYAVKMRQLSDENSLLRLLRNRKIDETGINQLAHRLSDFYQKAATDAKINTFGAWDMIQYNCEENFRQTESFAGEILDTRMFQIIRAASRLFLHRKKELFEDRVHNNKIRDCHGDLRSGHIYFNDEIQIIDCIEFNDRFRYADITSDLAFLAMDLDFEGFTETSRNFVDTYIRYSDDQDIYVLLDFYKCYRALVKSKVNCLRLHELKPGEYARTRLQRDAGRYLNLAYRYAIQFSRPTVWVICGCPATGKSTIAKELHHKLHISVLSSDRIRKQLFDLPPDESMDLPFEDGIYSKGSTALTYGKLLLMAQTEIEHGNSVVLDATFSRQHQRDEALRLSRNMDANIIFIECVAPFNLLKARLEKREAKSTSVSDARLHHIEQLMERYEPLTNIGNGLHIRINTKKPIKESIHKILSHDYFLLSQEVSKRIGKQL
jgi:aminoglycoside phosphotransferase family enzyme/predicted kinase